jgi:hypothetical protein
LMKPFTGWGPGAYGGWPDHMVYAQSDKSEARGTAAKRTVACQVL